MSTGDKSGGPICPNTANLGFIFQIRPELAELLRRAMGAQGLPVPESADGAAAAR